MFVSYRDFIEANYIKWLMAPWHLARSMSRLGTETAFEVLARARAMEAQGKDIIHLEVGEPDFDTPEYIRKAAKKALDEGWTHYGPGPGLPPARAAVAAHIAKTRQVKVDPDEVIITPGGKPIITFAILSMVDPGEEVITPEPGFPIYDSIIRFARAKPVPLPLRQENGFDLDPDDLKKRLNAKTRLLILNSPGNPGGNVLSAAALKAIARLLERFPKVMVLSDEIYSRIIYSDVHRSIISLPGMKERTILLDGFSKAYAMTGWRIGYGVAPKPLVSAMAKLASNFHSCTASFIQIAAAKALSGPQRDVDKMVKAFRQRRDAIVAGLNALPGFSCRMPLGAFYAFPDIRGTKRSSRELAETFLTRAGVACLSGTCFGPGGEGFLRFSYANSLANIDKALVRMRGQLE